MTTVEAASERIRPADLATEVERLLMGEERHMKEALDLLLSQAVLYLASDYTSYTTDALIRVDGGLR